MRERSHGSSWLLSEEAYPSVERPKFEAHEVRMFRMPSCIGKPAHYGIARGTPQPELVDDDRFRDRTLLWFSDGEQRARDECARFEAGRSQTVRRRLLALAVGVGAFGVGALVTSLLL